MSEATLPGELERLLRDDDGALYADEAAARAIAIVIRLFEHGHYSWPEWIDKFSAEIAAPGHYRHSEDGAKEAEAVLTGDGKSINRNYAELWLSACEKLLLEKGLVTRSELDETFAALGAENRPAKGSPSATGLSCAISSRLATPICHYSCAARSVSSKGVSATSRFRWRRSQTARRKPTGRTANRFTAFASRRKNSGVRMRPERIA